MSENTHTVAQQIVPVMKITTFGLNKITQSLRDEAINNNYIKANL